MTALAPLTLTHVPLEDAHVRLKPYASSAHARALRAMAEANLPMFEFWSHRHDGDWITDWLNVIEARAQNGTTLAYAVLHPLTEQFLGITSYLDPSTEHRHVEIGMTAYARDVQGKEINPACKRLLLGHAFACGALRVQFQIDELNQRSQAAVLKLGATREGTLRQHKVIASGYVRNTCVFSILKDEWPAVKAGLDARLPQTA
jgi:N-acetyltransferase